MSHLCRACGLGCRHKSNPLEVLFNAGLKAFGIQESLKRRMR